MGSKLSQLNESFELEGYWWLPANPAKKIPGVLHYKPDRILLDLMGSFSDFPPKFDRPAEYEIILGVSLKGEPITLHRCYESNYTMSFPGFASAKYSVIQAFIGHHFEKSSDIKFKDITIIYSNLSEWLGIFGFQHDINELFTKNTIGVRYTPPNEIKIKINEALNLIFGFGYSASSIMANTKEVRITQETGITIEPLKEIPYEEFRTTIFDIRNFLSLGTLNAVYPLRIRGRTESNKKTIDNQTIQPSIEIYLSIFDMPEIVKEQSDMDMLFTYRDVSDKIEQYFKTWIEKRDNLEPIYNLYFGVVHNKHLYLEQMFLSLIQAAESYHRRTSKDTELPESQHKERITAILESTPQKYKDWIERKLLHSNELPLHKRLDILLQRFSFITDDYSGGKDGFVRLVVNTRNYLTHYDISNQTKPSGNILYELCQRLSLLVESCLLFELGMETQKIHELINKSKRQKGITR